MGDFIFDLQRFTDVTVTPTATDGLKDGSTITVTFQDQNGSNVTATFTYNATTNSFNETHSVSSFLAAARAYIETGNIVIQLDDFYEDFSVDSNINTITLDTANNKWIISKGERTYRTSNYSFSFNGTTISYDANNAFSSSFKDIIFGTSYTITIGENTYPVEFDGDGNLTKVNGTDLVDGQVTIDGKTYNFSGNTSSITYNEVVSTDLFTLTGVKTTDGIVVDETAKTVTIGAANLDAEEVTITDGYSLKLADDVQAPIATTKGFDGFAYKDKDGIATAGYTLADNKITYTATKNASTLFTLTGIKSTEGITVEGTTVTIGAANLDAKKVMISGDYKLALADDVDTVAETINDWSTLSNGNVAYLEAAEVPVTP